MRSNCGYIGYWLKNGAIAGLSYLNIGQAGARWAASDRGLDWDFLTEDEREEFCNMLNSEVFTKCL